MFLILTIAACSAPSPPPGGDDDAGVDPDLDGDGFGASVDCRDDDRFIFPGAPEPCDGVDNNCDGVIDDGFDRDDDGWTVCEGDCRDNDAASYPGAPEVADGVDNDCDGIVDGNTEFTDDDGDGWSEDQGDCDDDPVNLGQYVNPAAVEVQLDMNGDPEGVDNDCDGLVDEALEPCLAGGDPDDPWSYAHALDACNFVTSARWNENIGIEPSSRAIRVDFGDTYVSAGSADFIVLSTGHAADRGDPGFVDPPSTAFQNQVPHPDPLGAMGCSSADPSSVNDFTEVDLHLQVPSNASAFSFDFNFMSAEFPEWVCSSFDDTFLALLESAAFDGNISFDAMGNRVSINVGFFDVCAPGSGPGCTGSEPLAGTGFESDGGTGWLTTTAPVIPGEKIRLRFLIFDEGDHVLDSLVLIDNFRWEVDFGVCPDGTPPPCTIGRESGPRSRFVIR